jgi:hypothetical protein
VTGVRLCRHSGDGPNCRIRPVAEMRGELSVKQSGAKVGALRWSIVCAPNTLSGDESNGGLGS